MKKRARKVFNNHRVETSTKFQADQSGPVNLSSDIEPKNIRRSNLKGMDSGEYVIFPSPCAAGSPSHTHKVDLSVGHCPYFHLPFKKAKARLTKPAGFCYRHIGISYIMKRGLDLDHGFSLSRLAARQRPDTGHGARAFTSRGL